MKYYVKRRKVKIKPYLLVVIAIFALFNLFLYLFDTRVLPAVLLKSQSVVKAKTIQTISETSLELFNNEFKYDEMIIIDKDEAGDINLIRADTVKLNYLSSQLSIKCNDKASRNG